MLREDDGSLSRRTVLSAILVAAIVLAGVVLTALTLTGGDEGAGGGPSAGETTETAGESVCGLDREDTQEPPSEPPEVDEWGGNGPLAVPMSEEYGPGREKNEVHSCFSNGPKGALLAATSFAADISNPTVSADEARGRFLRPEASEMLAGTSAARSSGRAMRFVGFRFLGFSPGDEAAVSLAFSTPTGSGRELVAVTYTMRWAKGDWRADLPSNGELGTADLPDLTGYVEWGSNA